MLSPEDPKVACEPLKLIDATPDKYYPLRILRAYRGSCNFRWGHGTGEFSSTNPMFSVMNAQCDERARILDEAIAILETGLK